MNKGERRSLAKRQINKKLRAGKTALSTAEQALNGAMAHHQAGRFEEAETVCRQVLQSDPDNPAATSSSLPKSLNALPRLLWVAEKP